MNEDYDAADFFERQQIEIEALDDQDAYEIEEAQKNLNFYPDNCDAFWESVDGQETIQIAKKWNLRPTVSNEKRKRLYKEACAEATKGG